MNIEIISYVNAAHGRQYPARKKFRFATDIVSKGLAEQRNQRWSRKKRQWIINWQALEITGRNKLIELFDRAKGAYDTFLILDDDDNHCLTTECSITAGASDTTTQLIKTYYPGEAETYNENRNKIQPGGIYPPSIYLDGVLKTEDTHFTLDDTTGIIDWTGGGAPNGAMGGGEIITADYKFYFEVRFDSDEYDDIRNIPDHWQAEGIVLIEVVTV